MIKVLKFKSSRIYPTFYWTYATADGFPVLKDECKWWKHLNGFAWNIKRGTFMIQFRNHSK